MAGLSSTIAEADARGGRGVSIRAKIVAMTVGVAFVTAAAVGGVNVVQIRDSTRLHEANLLGNEAGLIAAHLKTPFDAIRNATLMLAQTPPFEGIARATANRGSDPADGSSLADWRKRLETIFDAMLRNFPPYLQLRYIGLADGGREIVRVDRTRAGIRAVPTGELQEKADQPYFPEGVATPRGEVRLSALSLNHDQGNIDYNLPVVRAMSPVYGPGGGLFGLLVVNARYDDLLDTVFRNIRPTGDLYVLTEAGDYIVKLRRREFGLLHLASEDGGPPPAAIAAMRGLGRRAGVAAFEEGGVRFRIATARVDLGDLRPGHEIAVGLAVPESRIERVADAAAASAMTTGGLLVAAITVLAFFFANLVTRPLRALADEIGGEAPVNSVLARRGDEIGDAYRAYEGLSRKLADARSAEGAVIERMRTMRYKAADALIVIDEAGTIVEFNESAQKMFGYADYEAVGRNVSMLMPSPHRDAHDSYLTRYIETGEKRIIGGIRNVEALRRNGELFPAELRVSEFEIDGRRYFNGNVRDVTERVALQRRVAVQMDELARSNADLDAFARVAAGSLDGPLHDLERGIRALEADCGAALGDEAREKIARLGDMSASVAGLARDLLEWRRIGEAELVRVAVDPAAVVAAVRDRLAASGEAAGADVAATPGMPDIHGDRAMIEDLFAALIGNGLAYNDSARKTVGVGYRVDAPGPAGAPVAAFYVADNGIGVAPADRSAAFRLFSRLDGSDAYRAGAGAGLSRAQRIVERHGGRIWFGEAPEGGAAVFFTLPLIGDRRA
jgi:PAS domain S-box-containing protein